MLPWEIVSNDSDRAAMKNAEEQTEELTSAAEERKGAAPRPAVFVECQ
jgi:hypothetical protein